MSRLLDRRKARKVNVNGLRRDPRTGAGTLAKSERGYGGVLAFDFTDQSAVIYDPTTQANVSYGQGFTDGNGNLRGPARLLTYTSPANKLVMQANGNITYSAHNLILQSEDVSTTWTAGNVTTTASRITGDGANATHVVFQDIVGVANATYTFSAKAKAGTGNFLLIAPNDASANGAVALFNLSTGAVGSSDVNSLGSAYSNLSTSISDAGDGYYLCSVTLTIGSSTTIRFSIGLAENATTTTWANAFASSDYIDVTDIHLYRYPAVTDYVKTTSATVYSLPYEYDTAGACKGLLVEEARTNLELYSSLATNRFHGGSASTTANAAQSPTGLTDASEFKASSGGGTGTNYSENLTAYTVSTSTAYTFSVYLKQGGVSWAALSTKSFTTPGDVFSYFNLGTGSLGTAGTGHTASITDVGNGWYRCAITFTTDASDTSGTVRVYLSDGDGDVTVAQDGVSSIYVWGGQFESGSFPTSPILTYGSTATRALDNISIATSAFPLSATAGSILAIYTMQENNGSNPAILSITNGTTNECHIIDATGPTAARYYAIDGGVYQVTNSLTINTDGTQNKIASAFAANDFATTANGGSVTTDVSGTLPTVTTLYTGGTNGHNIMTGTIAKVSYVPRRKSDSELQTETT